MPKSYPVWRLIFGVKLTGLRNTQIAGKALVLDVSVKIFSEEIGQSKEDPPSLNKEGHHPISWGPGAEQKGRGLTISFSFLELGHPSSSALEHQNSKFSGLETQGLAPAAFKISRPSASDYELHVTHLVLRPFDYNWLIK